LVDKCAQVAPDAKEGIGRVLGIAVKLEKPKIARVACTRGSKLAFEYQGARECGVAADLMGGFLACEDGCLGLGDCARACPLSAIEVREGKVRVDEGKCTGCGICARVCPRGIIKLVPVDARVFLACNSPRPGKIVAAACSKGCLVCRLCERACEQRAITIENNLPLINLELCSGCGACVEACKRGVLEFLGGSQAPAQAG
jgi:Fe-S-cluster-containing hydrogenase component 2